MKITFTEKVSAFDSLIFDRVYEPGLEMNEKEKSSVLERAIKSYMLVDGELAGETFGVRLKYLDENIEDCDKESGNTIYCYSTTILPVFQGKGLAKILKSFWLGQCFGAPIVGHSTSPEMKLINELFGAVHSVSHEHWYDTDRTAWFYHLHNE